MTARRRDGQLDVEVPLLADTRRGKCLAVKLGQPGAFIDEHVHRVFAVLFLEEVTKRKGALQ